MSGVSPAEVPGEPLDPREERRRLFSFERNTVVRAGAGTGKTEALATVYLHLVSGLASPAVWPRGGLSPERIVALTFTEKAAREMRERIAEAVDQLSGQRLPRELESLDDAERSEGARRWASARGLSNAVTARVLCLAESAVRYGRAMPGPELWQRVAWSLGTAQIGTFHGFAAGVLRRAAHDLGLDPAFEVLEQEEADRLLRAASLGALSDAAKRDVLAVVELMSAGGGLGERSERGLVTLITSLVQEVQEDGLRADALGIRAAIAPTDAMSSECAQTLERFASRCEAHPKLAEDGTAARMHELSRAVEALPVMDSPEQALARMRLLRSLSVALPGKQRTRKLEPGAQEARDAIEALLHDAASVVSLRLGELTRSVVAEAQRRYEVEKNKRAAVDFADLMRNLRDALRDRPGLRREWKNRYDAVLVDEFQDTNQVQRDLLYLLREKRDTERTVARGQSLGAAELEPTGLLLVGDAKQSIYAFRGAEVAVFLSTESELAAVGGEKLELTDSFRALDALISVLNPLTEVLLKDSKIGAMYDPRRETLRALGRGDGETRVELLLVPEARASVQRRSEAEAITSRILELTAKGEGAPAEGFRRARMDDIAIIVPSWSHLEPVKRALQSRGVPFALRGGPGFWDRREIDDLVVLLRFVADPSDGLSQAALLRGPLVGLTDAGMATLFASSSGLEDRLDPPASVRSALCAEDRTRLDEARPSLRRFVRFGPTLGPHGVLRQCLAERGYASVLAKLPFGAQRVANVDKLVGLAAAAVQRGGDESDLHGFVQYVNRMREASQRESEADLDDAATGSVQVMSIHAAKGLEWPVVFVAQSSRRPRARTERILMDAQHNMVVLPGGIDATEGFKAIRAEASGAEDEDSRRLLYVALTRARDLLVVSGPEGEGEGDWSLLKNSLTAQGPSRVRTLGAERPAGPAIAVRARKDPTEPVGHGENPEGSPALEVSRRRLAVLGAGLQDFALCPRRFHALYDLGLREHAALSPEGSQAEQIARKTLDQAPLARLVSAPMGALERTINALGLSATNEVLEAAGVIVQRFVESDIGKHIANDVSVVMSRGLSWASKLEGAGREVLVSGRLDLLMRAEVFGREGLIAVRYAMPPEREDRWDRGSAESEVELELSRAALARRYREGGVETSVHAAVLPLFEEGGRLEFSRRPRDPLGAERVVDLAEGIERARSEGRWEARPRYVCDGMRCGFIPRCHG